VTTAVCYLFAQSDHSLLNYLDDFVGAEDTDVASDVFNELGLLLQCCGLEESTEKAEAPCTRLAFVGVLHDTVSMTLEVTPERLNEISLLVQAWLRKKKCVLKELQSMLGKLPFVCVCVCAA
jgi:hypothetical protein